LEGLAPVRVVIADDDEAFLGSLRALIEAQPELEVIGMARDGLEAIELTEALEPDAVVIDPHMPRLDGVSAIARLRRDHPNVCLIALTGDSTPPLHHAVRDAGADGVFLKGDILTKLLTRLAATKGG
jgi:two-component system, NarL family, response regulator DesR